MPPCNRLLYLGDTKAQRVLKALVKGFELRVASSISI